MRAHLAAIGCNVQEISRAHLAAIGCNGLSTSKCFVQLLHVLLLKQSCNASFDKILQCDCTTLYSAVGQLVYAVYQTLPFLREWVWLNIMQEQVKVLQLCSRRVKTAHPPQQGWAKSSFEPQSLNCFTIISVRLRSLDTSLL